MPRHKARGIGFGDIPWYGWAFYACLFMLVYGAAASYSRCPFGHYEHQQRKHGGYYTTGPKSCMSLPDFIVTEASAAGAFIEDSATNDPNTFFVAITGCFTAVIAVVGIFQLWLFLRQ